jgi:hypothetical protein
VIDVHFQIGCCHFVAARCQLSYAGPHKCDASCVRQVFVRRPLLRRAIDDVSTARAMLLALPPELLLRVPAIARFLHEITGKLSAARRQSSDDGGAPANPHHHYEVTVGPDEKRGPLAGLAASSDGGRRTKLAVS